MRHIIFVALAFTFIACGDKQLATKADIENATKGQNQMNCVTGEVSIEVKSPANGNVPSYVTVTDVTSSTASDDQILGYFRYRLTGPYDPEYFNYRYSIGKEKAESAKEVKDLSLPAKKISDIRKHAKVACGPGTKFVQSEGVEDSSTQNFTDQTHYFTCLKPCE